MAHLHVDRAPPLFRPGGTQRRGGTEGPNRATARRRETTPRPRGAVPSRRGGQAARRPTSVLSSALPRDRARNTPKSAHPPSDGLQWHGSNSSARLPAVRTDRSAGGTGGSDGWAGGSLGAAHRRSRAAARAVPLAKFESHRHNGERHRRRSEPNHQVVRGREHVPAVYELPPCRSISTSNGAEPRTIDPSARRPTSVLACGSVAPPSG